MRPSLVALRIIALILVTALWMPLMWHVNVGVSIGEEVNATFFLHLLEFSAPTDIPEVTTPPVVAYVVTLTGCAGTHSPWFHTANMRDAAAVLKRSVERSSRPLNPTARYGAKVYALVHSMQQDSVCASDLASLGYEVLVVDIPVPNPLTRDDLGQMRTFKKKRPQPWVHYDGCCGELEFIKLRLYELVHHPVAVLLDLDVMLLRPLDALFDAIVLPGNSTAGEAARQHLLDAGLVAPTFDTSLPRPINAFFTKDYSWAKKPEWTKKNMVGVQGGFMVVRPDLDVFDELKGIIREGNFVMGRGEGSGWGGRGYGRQINGAMTFQGMMPYFYEVVSLTDVELHRCRFNQMAENHRFLHGRDGMKHGFTPLDPTVLTSEGACFDGRDECNDVRCQTWPVKDSFSIHFTLCGKPWECGCRTCLGTQAEATCHSFFREWFALRLSLG